jgi:O-antigen ligase
MRWLLALLIGVIVVSDIMSWPLSLGPGLSVKNAALYALLFALFFRAALRGLQPLELPALHVLFAVWVFYATATWVVAATIIHYPQYLLIPNALTLKADLYDSVLLFLLAFHGLRDSKDVQFVFKALALGVGIASIATLTDVAGLTHLGITVGSRGAEEGRVFGVFGHANDTAALLDGLLPVSVAAAIGTRGPTRVFWWLGALASLTVLMLTVSRGGYVGLVVGAAWGAWMCRHMLPLRRVAGWAVGAAATIVIAVSLVSLAVPHTGSLIADRVFGGSAGGGVEEMSSGRASVWMGVIDRMMDNPITLLTGYGWDVYFVMPFRFATHNYYLYLWFDLGVIGLGAFIGVLAVCVRYARRAALTASDDLRPYLIAGVFGILMLSIGVFFCNLSGHWQLVWIYVGVCLRAALVALESPAPAAASARVAQPREPFGLRPLRVLPGRPH